MPPLLKTTEKPYVIVTSSEADNEYVVSKPSASPLSPKRSVRFAEDVICRVAEPQQEQADSSIISSAWYSAVDYQRFKQESKNTLRQMVKKIKADSKTSGGVAATSATATATAIEEEQPTSDEYCSVGLENYLPSKLRVRSERRYLLIDIVLECQEELKEKEDWRGANTTWSPEEYIAWRSRHQSEKSRLEAQIRGEQLAVELYRMNWNVDDNDDDVAHDENS